MKLIFPLKKDTQLIDKINYSILFFIRISLIIAIVSSIFTQRWTILFVAIITLLLTFLPKLFEARYKINLPLEFEVIIIAFIYATLFLGEAHGYYVKFWWWDAILHTGSAIVFGFIGFLILYVLHKGDKIKASPSIIAFFAFFFAMGIGALWEIFEFSIDQLFRSNMQKSGLIDTMWDLIVNSFGALIASLSGYFYLKKEEVFLFRRLIERFTKENERILK
ncbi:MAG: hypothetical protein WDZ77_02600 [Candidatus Pacearchaeota archaeon]